MAVFVCYEGEPHHLWILKYKRGINVFLEKELLDLI